MRTAITYFLGASIALAACQGDVLVSEGASFQIDTIETPPGLTAEVAALDFLADGRLVAAFMRGEVMIYEPDTKEWRVFATGLHEPLGLKVINDREMLVMQLPELTRIKDTDGDGKADMYETVYDGFGMTGNYHEFTYGPVEDSDGNLYFALNSSSAGGGISAELRGDTLMDGKSREGKPMFSIVPYRGWVMKMKKNGEILPFASGFRSPNGLGFDAKGRLFVTDNQGDWVGSSPLHYVQEGKFYGHPASLVWTKGWNRGNPFELNADTLNAMREKPAVIFPHNVIANSPTQPVQIRHNKMLKPFEGQFIVGEMNQERLVRIMLEDVNGVVQGAVTPFIDGQGLRKGNNRLVFAPDGSLWVGQSDHGWLGDRGIQRISFTGKTPFDVADIHLLKNGFEMYFTQPIDLGDSINIAKAIRVRRYNYLYHQKYGSPEVNLKQMSVHEWKISNRGKRLQIDLGEMEKDYLYEITLDSVFNKQRTDTLLNKLVVYTVKETL
ncbi:PQQ-dependent sugar dehydrogenase [Sphingobacterium sp. SGR-19]|uniref:PQQ-dependent sugar dehydrogenase n=1 Tax=Sphingobacterium sp. SGR-19 TaxID=2710886 RepID=UPI0013EC204F|nr:PQQ-dependent sugar dehydrogenase [Sphingobacterium sp. SGR-19]NGM64312.1 hypothetical protein [Sphingobacterium sp. SGR-19]